MGPAQNIQTEGGHGISICMHQQLTLLCYLRPDIPAALGSTKHMIYASSVLASTKMLPWLLRSTLSLSLASDICHHPPDLLPNFCRQQQPSEHRSTSLCHGKSASSSKFGCPSPLLRR